MFIRHNKKTLGRLDQQHTG